MSQINAILHTISEVCAEYTEAVKFCAKNYLYMPIANIHHVFVQEVSEYVCPLSTKEW